MVSTVIPVHNGEAFIDEAIASVLEQTYERAGVHRRRRRLDRRHARGRGRVRATDQSAADTANGVRPQRGTPARTRRAGEYLLAFLDADDVWEPTKIERQIELVRRRPELGLVYCSFRFVDAKGGHLAYVPSADPSSVLRNVLLNAPPAVGLGSTGLVPRSTFWAVGDFDPRLSRGVDTDLGWRLAAQVPIAGVPEPLVRYRQHPAQIHRNTVGWERDNAAILDKAFSSGLLPPEVQALERRARTNLALTVAYLQSSGWRRRRDGKVGEAFRLSPLASPLGGLARATLRRLAAAWPWSVPPGATSRASSGSRGASSGRRPLARARRSVARIALRIQIFACRRAAGSSSSSAGRPDSSRRSQRSSGTANPALRRVSVSSGSTPRSADEDRLASRAIELAARMGETAANSISSVIEKRRPCLDRVGHRRHVQLDEQVAGKVSLATSTPIIRSVR